MPDNEPRTAEEMVLEKALDALDALADRWMALESVGRMTNAICSIFSPYAPEEIMSRFREKVNALMHQAFVEGALEGRESWRSEHPRPTPRIDGDEVVRERQAVVAWLRHQADLGANRGIEAEIGTTKRAAFGGGSLALARAADAIEAAEHRTNDNAALSRIEAPKPFQNRVEPWLVGCFGPEIACDKIERNHRFLEEALELVQSLGCTASEAHQLVDYTFGRPAGEPAQEVGGVMVTLAALCLANDMDMHASGETELARIWTKVDAIRAKQAAKPKHSPLPEAPKTEDREAG